MAEPTFLRVAMGEADALVRRGKIREAEACYRQLLESHPGSFILLLRVAQVFEFQGRVAEAVRAYEAAIAANPGHSFAFTRRALLRYRSHFGAPVPARASAPRVPRVTMSTLGMNGRFGNQLLQYGFLRMYAAEHGLQVEAPDWIGRDLFDLADPLPRGALPQVRETDADFVASLNRESPDVWRNVDLWGYCCFPTGGLCRYRDLFRGMFRPGSRMAPIAAAAEERLRSVGDTVVAVHMRRGDFGYGRFWIAPDAWYHAWLEALWPTLARPVLYVASDDPSAAADFVRFRPLTAVDLGLDVPGAEFFADFQVLTRADALAISNSTFSFTAAMLNMGAVAFMRPDRVRDSLVGFDPWNAPVLI